jgi:hypothetical protein
MTQVRTDMCSVAARFRPEAVSGLLFSLAGGRPRVRVLSVSVALVMIQAVASAQLPRPTNPNLVRLGYYFVDERYGDDTAAVWPYTNLYVALAGGYNPTNPWQPPFAASLQKATANHKAIYLRLFPEPGQPTVTDDAILDVAQNYWGQVLWVEVVHEPPATFTPDEMEQRIQEVNAKIAARGLSARPCGATFGDGILTTNAILAPSLSFATIEAYVPAPGDPDPQVNVNYLNGFLATAKTRVHNAGKGIFLTMQAYDRNGAWPNISTLEALQRPVYLNAYADPDVWGILMFAFNRPGGSKDHPELQQAHREIASVMGISPAMNIDVPQDGAILDAPHVQVLPVCGGDPIFRQPPGCFR